MALALKPNQPWSLHYQWLNWLLRTLSYSLIALAGVYLLNNYLNVWHDWPGVGNPFVGADNTPMSPAKVWLQLLSYLLLVPLAAFWVARVPAVLLADSQRFDRWAGALIRWSFWSVVLIGLLDGFISWLRVEGFLVAVFGETLGANLGKPAFRGSYVHFPLLCVGFILAWRFRHISVTWLALLVVLAEAWIVIARFVFSYEQTLMGDLVRFWYAALFLFASAYTLQQEAHVRVDVLYAGRSLHFKAWVNSLGVLLLGYPLCWIILTMGLWQKNSLLNGPMLNFEVSQSTYGLFVKYLMAGFLVIFAVSMLLQFTSYLLQQASVLLAEVETKAASPDQPTGTS